MIILGVDPGYGRVGLAVVDATAGIGNEELIYSDCFSTVANTDFHDRLHSIGAEVARLISIYHVDIMGIELLFFNTNQKTAMRVSEARGVIMYEALRSGVVVREYTPLQIKSAIVGFGRGTKAQIDAMVRSLIPIKKTKIVDDEMDAIAVALTCSATERRSLYVA